LEDPLRAKVKPIPHRSYQRRAKRTRDQSSKVYVTVFTNLSTKPRAMRVHTMDRASRRRGSSGPIAAPVLCGVLRVFSFSCRFGFWPRRGVARPCRLAGCRSVPESGGCRRSAPWWSRLAVRGVAWWPLEPSYCAVSGGVKSALPSASGGGGDTPPLKGCCAVTFGYRTRTC